MKILITTGPTREPIDAVRFISNRSSGRMGIAIAKAAADAGHQVTLLHGPGVDIQSVRDHCKCFPFGSSAELKQVMEAHWSGQELLVMTAAVADYRPEQVMEGKLPRNPQGELVLKLHPTPDLVALAAATRGRGQKIIAFALEEVEVLEERALTKLQRKGVDAIVANPLGTMESDGITAIYMTAKGQRLSPGRMSKEAFGKWLIDQAEKL